MDTEKPKKSTLTIVGTGIKTISQLTHEAKLYIEKCDKVLYLVNEPLMQEWIQRANPKAEALDPLYTKFPIRLDCYRAITDYILESLEPTNNLCVVLYGHPTVFARPALEAARKAKEQGYDVHILPGISAKDCLFADLMVDPGSCGCASFEATDFLVYGRKFDPSSHLILWQVGIVGILGHLMKYDSSQGTRVLTDYLLKTYPADHEVTVYEASQYHGRGPRIEKCALEKLPSATLTPISTLYIPPAFKAKRDDAMLEALNIKLRGLA
jgi:uncharacterized protein YabN with tetrapyrrole methylase and pyrophosphatase domain